MCRYSDDSYKLVDEIDNKKVSSIFDCQALCTASVDCLAMEYNEETNICFGFKGEGKVFKAATSSSKYITCYKKTFPASHTTYKESGPCGFIRDGGCVNYGTYGMSSPSTLGWTVEQCQAKCKETTDCWVILHGKSGGNKPGACHLYKRGAIEHCGTPSDTAVWSMYSLEACRAGLCGKLWKGGCKEWETQRLPDVKTPGNTWTVESCRKKCKESSGFGVFIYGLIGGPSSGQCHLYKKGALQKRGRICLYSSIW
jgi:hypothetical protein